MYVRVSIEKLIDITRLSIVINNKNIRFYLYETLTFVTVVIMQKSKLNLFFKALFYIFVRKF